MYICMGVAYITQTIINQNRYLSLNLLLCKIRLSIIDKMCVKRVQEEPKIMLLIVVNTFLTVVLIEIIMKFQFVMC